MPPLRDPILHSNWVWILGAFLLLIAVIWVAGMIVAYRRSQVRVPYQVRSLSQVHRVRYQRLIDEVSEGYRSGRLGVRETHLALAAIIRAASTERTGVNLEAATVSEARAKFPSWVLLADALTWCEDGAFPTEVEEQRVERGLELAQQVVLT